MLNCKCFFFISFTSFTTELLATFFFIKNYVTGDTLSEKLYNFSAKVYHHEKKVCKNKNYDY